MVRWHLDTLSTKESQLDWHEGRRRRVWELKQHGWKQSNIAAALKERLRHKRTVIRACITQAGYHV